MRAALPSPRPSLRVMIHGWHGVGGARWDLGWRLGGGNCEQQEDQGWSSFHLPLEVVFELVLPAAGLDGEPPRKVQGWGRLLNVVRHHSRPPPAENVDRHPFSWCSRYLNSRQTAAAGIWLQGLSP